MMMSASEGRSSAETRQKLRTPATPQKTPKSSDPTSSNGSRGANEMEDLFADGRPQDYGKAYYSVAERIAREEEARIEEQERLRDHHEQLQSIER